MKEVITVYRLQHKVSLLGPFEHRLKDGSQSKLVSKLISHKDPNEFKEFRDWCEAQDFDRDHLLPREWVFGWASLEKIQKFTRDGTEVWRYGFELVHYKTDEYVKLPDGQVIFNREYQN